ncbi:MAG TPA: ATP-binding protein [Sphingomicrobium sp.]|nr:ATP-binding protein [Sphingomicrobium sp.]
MWAAIGGALSPRARFALASAALAIVYFVTAAVSMATFGTNTPIWFANAFAVVWMLQVERRRWPALLFLIYIVDTAAIAVTGSGSAPVMALADVAEIFLVVSLTHRLGGGRAVLTSVSGLAWFILLCLGAAIPSATWGAFILWWAEGVEFVPALQQWYRSAALGLLVICPPLLIWTTPELRARITPTDARRTAVLALGLAALAALVFSQGSAAYLFVTFPALLLLVWSSGLFGASVGSAVLLAVGIWETLAGGGAMATLVLPATDVALRIHALQVYLVALTLSSLPLAVVLTNQRELSRQLCTVAEARSEFLAAMSHEIRTPMTGVLGIADLLEVEELTPRQRNYVHSIRASGRHLLNIINDILDFSRIETGRIELEHVDFSVPMLLEELRSLLHPLAAERGVELRFELAPHSPPAVKGDPTRIKQVLLNLAANAIKFTDQGSVTIAVSYEHVVDGLIFRFEVQDTGIGIAADKQSELFTPFTQADHSTSRRYGGSGLGLAISKRLVAAMDGEIGLRSSLGSGSLFWFEIPLQAGEATNLTAPAAKDCAPIAPCRILVAEDVELNRDIVTMMLERDGHSVVLAEDGHEALAHVEQSAFDLVLMDVQMPRMDGMEATRRIRMLPGAAGQVPIVALTANVMAIEQEKCLKAGMNAVLMKPIEWERLRAVVRKFGARIADPDRHGSSGGEAPEADERGEPPVLVEPTFAKLKAILPRGRLKSHIEAFDAEVEVLAKAGESGDRSAIQRAAHKIVSEAGSLGLARLSARAAAVEAACRDKGGLGAALRRFREAAGDSRGLLGPPIRRKAG